MPLRRDFTFDRFVVTPASASAYRACAAIAECAEAAPRVLLLYGPTGTGKTHLLHSIGHAVLRRDPAARLACISVDELTDDLVEALRRDRPLDVRRKYSQVEMLLVDDVHVLAGRPATQREIATTLSACVNAGARIAVAGTAPPTKIAELSARLRSMPRSQLVAAKRPRQPELRRILDSLAAAHKLDLTTGALNMVARRSAGDVRRAVGMLVQLRFTSRLPFVTN